MEDKTILSNSQIKSKARQALKGNWGTAIITFIIFNIIMHGATCVHNASELSNCINQPYGFKENVNFGTATIVFFINLLLAGPMTYGITKFCMNLVRDKNHKIENMFEGFKQFSGTFIINIVLGIYSFLWSLLLFIPFFSIITIMIIKEASSISNNANDLSGYTMAILILLIIVLTIALSMILFRYAMTYYIYIDNPNKGAMNAIKESVSMMKGNKTRLLLLYLSFILWYILGITTIGIAFLWIIPYIKSSVAVFYDELKEKNEANYNAEEVTNTL